VVTPSVGLMPLMIQKGLLETHQTGHEVRETGEAALRERQVTQSDECTCDHCQAASRDEMWIRWA
jgi:predicted methyltransferase